MSFLTGLKTGKSKVKALEGLASAEDPLLAYQVALLAVSSHGGRSKGAL